MESTEITSKRMWRLLWVYMVNRKRFIVSIFLCILAISLSSMLQPRILSSIVETLENGYGETPLPALMACLFVVMIVASALTLLLNYLSAKFGENISFDIKKDFFSSINKMTMSEIDKTKSGGILSLFNTELNSVSRMLTGDFVKTLIQPVLFLVASAYMIWLDWRLYFICYILLPVVSFTINKIMKWKSKYYDVFFDRTRIANELTKEVIDGIVEIKTMRMESVILERCRSSFDNLLAIILKTEKIDAISIPVWLLNNKLPQIMCLVVGSIFAFNGSLTLAQLVAYMQLVLIITRPVSSVLAFRDTLRKGWSALTRLSQTIFFSSENSASFTDHRKAVNEKGIAFSHVRFSYDDESKTPVLRDVSFRLDRPAFYALAGASGQGKTSVFDIIAGLYAPQEGSVAVHKALIEEGIAYLPQDNVLYHDTIANNISFGDQDADMLRIEQAAKMAEIHDFIASLADGYQTIIAERGQSLSGGQRQRIAMARAFYKNSELMLFDEPTSSLDHHAEIEIIAIMQKLTKDHFLFISSHRLSTIMQADKIYVLDGGYIVQSGTHEELWQDHHGKYYQLYAHQMKNAR